MTSAVGAGTMILIVVMMLLGINPLNTGDPTDPSHGIGRGDPVNHTDGASTTGICSLASGGKSTALG